MTFRESIKSRCVIALCVVINGEIKCVFTCVRAKVQANILCFSIAILCGYIKGIADGGDGRSDIPLRNPLEFNRTGAGYGIIGKGDTGKRLEIGTLSLIIACTPVAVGGSDPGGIGIIGRNSVRVIIETATIENQALCRHSAYNNAIKSTIFKIHLAKLAPRAGVKLIVNADHTIEGDVLEGYMGVGRNSQQQAGANVIDTGVTSSAAGNGASNKNYIFTIIIFNNRYNCI